MSSGTIDLTTAELHDLQYAKRVLYEESKKRGNPIELEDAYSILDQLIKSARIVRLGPNGSGGLAVEAVRRGRRGNQWEWESLRRE